MEKHSSFSSFTLEKCIILITSSVGLLSRVCCWWRPWWFLLPVLLPKVISKSAAQEAMVTSMVQATTGGLWMSAVPVATRDHIGAYGLYCYLRSYWYLWSFYTWGTNRCLWPDLPPEAMSMSVIHNVPKTMLMSTVHAVARYHADVYGLCDVDVCSHASSRGHVDVHDPFYHQRPCWCP